MARCNDPVCLNTVFIGIDNGSTGSIGLQEYSFTGVRTRAVFMLTPVHMIQDYQKRAKRISQLRMAYLRKLFRKYKDEQAWEIHIAMERPFTGKFQSATVCAARIHQQYLDLFEFMKLPPPNIIDSGQWQKKFLPKGAKKDALKVTSAELGARRWPKYAAIMKTHKDADGMWISEWMRKEIMGGCDSRK